MAASSRCSISVFCKDSCGLSQHHTNETSLTKLKQCARSIQAHLSKVGLRSGFRNEAEVQSEGDLISFRVGLFHVNPNFSVCPLHRDSLGLYWRSRASCLYPLHQGKAKPFRSFSIAMSRLVLEEFGTLVPLGSGICRNCLGLYQELSSSLNTERDGRDFDLTAVDDIDTHHHVMNTHESADHELHVDGLNNSLTEMQDNKTNWNCTLRARTSSIQFNSEHESNEESQSTKCESLENSQSTQYSAYSEESISAQKEKVGGLGQANQLLSMLSNEQMSPLRSQLQKRWEDIADRTKRYYKRKADEGITHVLEMIAPGQSNELKVSKLSVVSLEQTDDALIGTIVKMIDNTDNNNLRLQLIGLLATKYPKTELQNSMPSLTSHQYYKAKKLDIEASGLIIQPKENLPREKMDKAKLQHALSFFMGPSLVQAVSYGTREIKLDSGENLTIPDVVRTMCHSQIVNLYLSYCKANEFVSLGKSSLYKILNACAAAKRTSLQGLDNIAADGNESFKTLEQVMVSMYDQSVITKEQLDTLKAKLSQFKHYLKTDFKFQCMFEDTCADHCITWLLSDSKKGQFQTVCDHSHNTSCDRCQLLNEIENELLQLTEPETVSQNLEQIKDWKRHIIRTINQDQSRLNILKDLQCHQVLIIMDWAMKFLPRKYREKQSDWFGQRGKNWHVSVVIFKSTSGELSHRTFTHIFESVKQDWFSVASILEHTLEAIHQQMPLIKEAYIRSDNAGCYHCAMLWLTIPGISERTEIHIKNYCYSEAQSGKSYCDAKIAHMRTRMKTYVAAGHNILTADDMKTAIDYGKGVVGCQICVGQIDTSRQTVFGHRMKNITLYNEIDFHDEGMTVRQAYGIGVGIPFSNDKIASLSSGTQLETGFVLLSDFSTPLIQEGKVHKNQTELGTASAEETTKNNFLCTEDGCTAVFKSFTELEEHIVLGVHEMEIQRESTYDRVKRNWAKFCNDIVLAERKCSSSTNTMQGPSSIPQGWALKSVKARKRFPDHVKEYLKIRYESGANSGRKVTPQEVEKEMKSKTDKSGQRLFSAKDCLSISQIASFFSRLGNKTSSCEPNIQSDEDLMAVLADIDENLVFESLQ